jgi:uncharacterized protein (TIGR02145 family)
MKKKRLLIFISIMCAVNLSAQVTIGALEEPHNAAILDLSKVPSQKLGLLLPTVELVQLNLFNPLPGNSEQKLDAKGMVVYNKKTDFAENLFPGIHVWDGAKWGRIGCLPATITAHSPANKIATATDGTGVMLGITAADSPDLTYLWYSTSSASDYTGGTPISSATGASCSVTAATNDTYYYCVVTSSCNASADTSDVFTVNVVNLATLDPGSGRLSGRTAFDVAMENEGGTCGALSKRPNIDGVYADFTKPATNTRTYTFTPSGTVSNVRFVYVESEPGIVDSLIVNGDYSGAITGPSTCTATLYYDTELNDRVSGKTREQAFKVHVYAIYKSGEQDYSVKLTAEIQDCAFAGAYTTSGVWLEFMPYNLGADPDYATPEAQMAYTAASTDMTVYGGLYQWGRRTDGHQIRNSGTTPGPLDNSQPGDKFITVSSGTNWYNGDDPASDNLWTGATKGVNDPCPTGYKVPTMAQWRSIFNNTSNTNILYATINDDNNHNNWSWYSSGGTNGAYREGTLFLPAAGSRNHSGGNWSVTGSNGYYWSSSWNNTLSHLLYFDNSIVHLLNYGYRAFGFSVRCVAE